MATPPSNTIHLVNINLPSGQFLFKLDGPGHLVQTDKGGVVQGVGVKLYWGFGTRRILGSS